MMISRQILALALGMLAVATVRAADVPIERRINDRQIIDLLADIHNRGAALFNRGDAMGSYHLFEGSLRTVQPLLPADLQSDVTRGLAVAERQADPLARALTLHELIESVRKKLHPTAGPKGTKLPAPKPLTFDEPEFAPKTGSNPVPQKLDPPAKPVSNPSLSLPPPDPVPVTLEPLPMPRENPNIPDDPVRPKADPPKNDKPKDEGPRFDFPPLDPPKKDPVKNDSPPKVDFPPIDPPKKEPAKTDPPPKIEFPPIDPPKKEPAKTDPPPKIDFPPIDPPKKEPAKNDAPKKDMSNKDTPMR
ncbi:MAG TPA: hypothetical protein VGZ47_09700, partial [Gemmataceae bacterium]|nr:hypothetical protein [Gemmataceae bacterium]